MLWYDTNGFFLGILKFLPLWRRGEEKRWILLDSCNTSYIGQRGELQLLSKAFTLPPFTEGLVAGCTSSSTATHYLSLYLLSQLWQMFSSSIMLMYQRISAKMRGKSITFVFWMRTGNCTEKWIRGSEHTTFEAKCLFLSLTLQNNLF